MGQIRIIQADGSQEIIPEVDSFPERSWIEERVGGGFEFVWVLWIGKRTCMLVNEFGAILTPPLPFNPVATGIYWQASANRGTRELQEATNSWIHGTAILLEGIEVK